MKLRLKGVSRLSSLERQVGSFKDEIASATNIATSILNGERLQISQTLDSDLIRLLSKLSDYHAEVRVRDEEQTWSDQGLLALTEIFNSGSEDLNHSIDSALSFLVKMVKGNQAAIYLLNAEDNSLERVSTYAYGKKKFISQKVDADSGLLGECYLGGSTIYLTVVPSDYVKITSGLGEALPTCLILVPLSINDKKVGVMELAFFKPLEKFKIQFLERAGKTFAAFISDIQERGKMRTLLTSTESTTARLIESENILKNNMQEMQLLQERLSAQNEMLERSNKNLRLKQLEMDKLKSQEAELLESKLQASQAIHDMIVSRLKNRIQQLMEEKSNEVLNQN